MAKNWYIQEYDDWAIGPVESVGSSIRGLTVTLIVGDLYRLTPY